MALRTIFTIYHFHLFVPYLFKNFRHSDKFQDCTQSPDGQWVASFRDVFTRECVVLCTLLVYTGQKGCCWGENLDINSTPSHAHTHTHNRSQSISGLSLFTSCSLVTKLLSCYALRYKYAHLHFK